MDTQKKTIIIAAIIVIIIIVIFLYAGREYLTNVIYLDQVAMNATDPTDIHYLGRVRDWRGMSKRDYYVENVMNTGNHAVKGLKGDDYFKNQQNLGPKPLSYYFKSIYSPTGDIDSGYFILNPGKAPEAVQVIDETQQIPETPAQ